MSYFCTTFVGKRILKKDMLLINHQGQTLTDTDVLVALGEECKLILYNDDVNTFDYVIDTLVQVCHHTFEQAEQCAIIVHFKGKCDVKLGSYEVLVPYCIGLLDAGLSAEIEE